MSQDADEDFFLPISFIDCYDCIYVVWSMCMEKGHVCMEPAALAEERCEGDPSVIQRRGVFRFSSLLSEHCNKVPWNNCAKDPGPED